MARGASIHRAQIELSHVDRGVYETLQLTVARHPSETLDRMVMRILAFGLRYAEDLAFGRGVSATDEPDLWRREGDGRVIEWIDVGRPDAKRLIQASRKSTRCQLFVFGDRGRRWRKAQLETMKAPANLGVAYIDDGFVASLAATADRQIAWAMTVFESAIYLTTGDTSFETTPEIWLGDPLG
jgi:uncharacterized protein YaeQ